MNQAGHGPLASDGESTGGPRCTIGLLTWNAGQDLDACLRGVQAQDEPAELVWLDNGSRDGTPERLRALAPGLEPIERPASNLGFCAGHNRLLARCRTRYYLALNQDVMLAPDYVRRVCDWLDEQPGLALASGLILQAPLGPLGAATEVAPGRPPHDVLYSAGLVWPRSRSAFELGAGKRLRPEDQRRRAVAGVTGAAMVLRVDACRAVAEPPGEVFPEAFFAYGEEVDLALRLARAGHHCGVEGAAWALHVGQGSGGLRTNPIRARFILNHWLLMLRHDGWLTLARDLPWIARGELQYWLIDALRHPRALALALAGLARQAAAARRAYHALERRFGPGRARLDALRHQAREQLRAWRVRP